MKVITIEEHVADPAVGRAGAPAMQELSPYFGRAYDPAVVPVYSPTPQQLTDVDDERIADMDRHGITMQVLSNLSTQHVPADVAPALVAAANDNLAAAVRHHPGRFAAFAALPTTAPEAAVTELHRCVGELGFVGTMIHGRTDGEFLCAPRFDPLLTAVERLGVPLYLHPAVPSRATSDDNYEGGLDPVVATRFATAGWGWHNETGIHFLQLVLHGVFDRHPDLQVVLGHWGEMVPWFVDRLDEALPPHVTGLERTIGDYLRQNAYVTPSGMFSRAQLRYCLDVLDIDRLIYSVDYPFVSQAGALEFLTAAELSPEDREKVAHGNAERLLRLG